MDEFMKSLRSVITDFEDYFPESFLIMPYGDLRDLNMLGPIFIGFSFLKFLDCSLHSQNRDVYIYKFLDDTFLNESINEPLLSLEYISQFSENFDDYDKNNLQEFINNEEKVYNLFKRYLNSFNQDIQLIFDFFEFDSWLSYLKSNNILSSFIKQCCDINISEEYFSSPESFLNTINIFLYEKLEISDDSWYWFYTDYFKRKNKLCGTADLDKNLGIDINGLLIKLLFHDINLEQYTNLNIYNPRYDDCNLLDKSLDFIKLKNSSCNINYYGKLAKPRYLFDCIKIVMKSLLEEDNHNFYSTTANPGIPFQNISEYDLDFIISDYRGKTINEDIGFIHQFQDKLDNSSKLVIIIDNSDFNTKYITWMICSDNLEAIITFQDCFILVANSHKSVIRKNKFILIDTNLLKNKKTNLTNTFSDCILNNYKNFEDSEYSKVILNKDVLIKDYPHNEFDKYSWGFYNTHPHLIPSIVLYNTGAYLNYYPNFHELLNLLNKYKYPTTKIEEISTPIDCHDPNYAEFDPENPDHFLTRDYDYYYDYFKEFPDIRYYLKYFNFNNLMYDKNRTSYTLQKQKYNKKDGKSNITEKELNFIPLYSIITFDKEEIDENKINNYKIEKYGKIFYLKSDNFLRNFLVYYLDSDKGKEEFNYFNNGLGATDESFIYIRIPEIKLEIQREIVNAYELNEEHYNLVKQSRNNFKKNILDYKKVLNDLDKFNKMEVDTKTGKIVEMPTVKRHMFDGLLWPLSISYLNAVHGTHVNNPNEKLDFYLKLFEFLTAFIVIILISAIPNEEYLKIKKELWNGILFEKNNYSFSKGYKCAFGTWTTLYSRLLKIYKSNNISPIFSKGLIESFLNEEIYEIMNNTRKVRNDFPGHGVGVHESRAKQLIDDLKLKIDVVYQIFGYLNGFKLFYCEDDRCKIIDENKYKYSVVSLNGPCDQPIYGEITFKKPLKKDALYLNNSLNGDLLKLNENLIIFKEAEETYVKYGRNSEKHIKKRASGRYYLYLFNGFTKKKNKYNINYKCFQIETDEIHKKFTIEEWETLLSIPD